MTAKFHPLYAAILLCTATSLQAADNLQLDKTTVVSTAAGYEQKITDAPASISVISNEDLQRKRYSNLAQALDDVEGIDIKQSTGKTGGLDISIRGMPSQYTLILIDGRRQNPSGNVTPNGFGDALTSFMPPMSAIERIEVVRGPMSTLYGSDAMGGVINIITKKVAHEWHGSVSADYTLQEERDFGDTGGTSFYASGPVVEELVGLTVRGSFQDRQESNLKYGKDSTGKDIAVSQRGPSPVSGQKFNLGGRIDLTPTDNHDFALDFEKGRQKYNNDECQLGNLDGLNRNDCKTPTNTAIGYKDELKFERTQYALSHTGRFDFGTLESAITHNTTETIGRTIPGTIGAAYAGYPSIIGGEKRLLENKDLVVDSKLISNWFDNHITTIGGQYRHSKLEDGISPDQFKQESAAVFAENEWHFHPDFALTLGGRQDHHQAFGDNFSPRAYLVWNTTDNWTLKGGVSKGYKTPDIDALHSGINGVTGQGSTITIGNPNLKPEKSTSSELAVYFDNLNNFNANATVFHNKFKDKISNGPDIACSYNTGSCSQKINIDDAVSKGFELAGKWQFIDDWSIKANYTYTQSEQKSGADKGAQLTNTPKHVANTSLNWQTTNALGLWLKAEYRGKRARFTSKYANLANANGSYSTSQSIHDTLGKNLKAYTLFHLGGSYKATDALTFNATVYNLLDKDFVKGKRYTTHSDTGAANGFGYGTDYTHSLQSSTGGIEEGRRLWLSATYEF